MTSGLLRSLDRQPARWPVARRVERQRVMVEPGMAAGEARGIAFGAACRRCLLCLNAEECRRWLDEGGSNVAPASV